MFVHRMALLRMALLRMALLGLLAWLAGCAGSSEHPAPEPAWTEVRLPAAPAQPVIGALVRCDETWYAAGGLRDAGGATRPAAWSSADAHDWHSLPIAPSSYYGHRQELFGLACRGRELAALGAANGGQHGVPRISSWHSDPDGVLTEVPAPAEQYGGPRALNVVAIAGRPSGWLIAGNRVGPTELATAAVWLSPDGADFQPYPDALGLASSARGDSTVRGALTGPSDWYLFGDVRPPGSLAREPAIWSSSGGRLWARATLPPTPGDASVTALAVDEVDRMLAMGTLHGAPHAWSYDGSTWADAGGFPASDRPGAGVARVGDVTLSGRDAYAAVDDGTRWTLWGSADLHRWRPVAAPAQPATGGRSRLLLAGSTELLVVAESVGADSRLWVAPRPR